MLQEHDLIPFTTSPLPPGPWLVFSPHPDDESFGMGGTLILGRESNVHTTLVFLTEGGWTEESIAQEEGNTDLVSTRRREAEEASRFLNIEDIRFWNEKDRYLIPTDELIQSTQQVIKDTQPGTIFFPAPTELHPDHRATCDIVWQSIQQSGCVAHVLSYDIGVQSPVNYLIDITSVKDEKQKLMALYQSQISENRYVKLVNSLDTARTYTLPDSVEAAEGFYSFGQDVTSDLSLSPFQHMIKPYKKQHYDHPLVSVIVRTRNRPNLLAEALNSIAHQTFDDIEVIVVNDGGQDVQNVTDAFRNSVGHLVYISNHSNVGRSAALNVGIDHSTGDYISFLDDDDWWDETHIENLLTGIMPENMLVAYSGARLIDTNHTKHRELKIHNSPFDRNRLYYENYIPINTILISREIFNRGCRFDPDLPVFEDWDCWIKLMSHTIEFKHTPLVTANYRIHHNQTPRLVADENNARKLIYARGAKMWGENEIQDLMNRLAMLSKTVS